MDHFQSKLFDRINYERQIKVGTEHFKLKNLIELLQRLDDPHLKYPVIHVAGTKGKGSTSTMIGSVLTASGRKTGVYTSPHLETIRQRIAIDGNWISNEALEDVLSQIDPIVEEMDREPASSLPIGPNQATSVQNVHPASPYKNDAVLTTSTLPPQHSESEVTKRLTFFEIITAAAMLHFARQQCDAVVLEVGLGGRLDSTNVCQPDVCVITNISLDHTRQLGSTVDKIAGEKAGIIKQSIPVVSGARHPDAAQVIEDVSKHQNAPLFVLEDHFNVEAPSNTSTSERANTFRWYGTINLNPDVTSPRSSESAAALPPPVQIDNLRLKMLGRHQRLNAALAIAVTQVLNQQQWNITDDAIRRGLEAATLVGRTEVVQTSPTIIIDIAHNDASIGAMLEALQNELPEWESFTKRKIIFGTSKDKDCRRMLERIVPCFDELIATEYLLNPRATKASVIAETARTIDQKGGNNTVISICPTPETAWKAATESLQANEFLCIAGSAFLVAEMAEFARGH
ncbi:MAG: folylpolyglutamate synthase/dihydrofolate synthase family protein [Planctomycetota bacterium]